MPKNKVIKFSIDSEKAQYWPDNDIEDVAEAFTAILEKLFGINNVVCEVCDEECTLEEEK